MSPTVAGWIVIAVALLMLFVLVSLDRDVRRLGRAVHELLELAADDGEGARRGRHGAGAER